MIIFNGEFGEDDIGGWLVAHQGSLKDEILLEPGEGDPVIDQFEGMVLDDSNLVPSDENRKWERISEKSCLFANSRQSEMFFSSRA